MESDYLFYNEYEKFYNMAKTSCAFKNFCKEAFGEDFSQDGFSDIKQIDKIISYFPYGKSFYNILDIGCGNGKMLGYIQKRVPSFIYGFDYSEQAIDTARKLFSSNSEFRCDIIGKIDYPENIFDIIISMDTIYFAEDMNSFVKQANSWLKDDGIFIIGYQEGDVVPKTHDCHSTQIAKAFQNNNIPYSVEDITKESYELLRRKRYFALKYKSEFIAENNQEWFDMLIGQSQFADTDFNCFKNTMARYIYTAKKN